MSFEFAPSPDGKKYLHVPYAKGLNDALAYKLSKAAYRIHQVYMRWASCSDYAEIVYRNSKNETA